MKRWLDDPEEREAAALLAPLTAEPPVDPGARAQVWQAVQRNVRAPAGHMRRAAVGVVVVAVVVAGVAAGRAWLREDGAAPRGPVPEAVQPEPVRVQQPEKLVMAERPVEAAFRRADAPRPLAQGDGRRVARIALSKPDPERAKRVEGDGASKGSAPIAPIEPIAPAPAPAPDAELVAYRDARAAMRGDLHAGLTQMSAFIAAYPDGRFDAEARLSIIECKARLGRLADSEPDVASFLDRFPGSERAAEVRFIRAEIQRQVHHRCDRALPDYRAAAASPRVGDDARFFRGWCADALGDPAERDAALDAYLARAPAGRHAAAATALLRRSE